LLSRYIAEKSRLVAASGDANAKFVPLPQFVSIAGTVGNPKAEIDKVAVTRLLAGTIGNYVGGDAGRILKGIGNLGTGVSTNASGTNVASTNTVGNLIQGLGGLLQKPSKTSAAATNAPAKKERFKLNDLLK
jgi:hypothetical protein